MRPWDLQMYEVDAEAWFWVDQREGERIWRIYELFVQVLPIEKWENLRGDCVSDGEISTWAVKNRACL